MNSGAVQTPEASGNERQGESSVIDSPGLKNTSQEV